MGESICSNQLAAHLRKAGRNVGTWLHSPVADSGQAKEKIDKSDESFVLERSACRCVKPTLWHSRREIDQSYRGRIVAGKFEYNSAQSNPRRIIFTWTFQKIYTSSSFIMISTSNIIQFLPSTKSDPYRCKMPCPQKFTSPKQSIISSHSALSALTPRTHYSPHSTSPHLLLTRTHGRRRLPSTTTTRLSRRRLLLQKIDPQLRHTLQSAPTIRDWGLGPLSLCWGMQEYHAEWG